MSEANKRKWSNQKYREAIIKARLKQVLPQKDTKPERAMQTLLNAKGIYFEKHVPLLGQPDLFIPPRLCIFVDGDYWHKRPKQVATDNRVTEELTKQGYIILRFWEHEVYNSIDVVWARINDQINRMIGLVKNTTETILTEKR